MPLRHELDVHYHDPDNRNRIHVDDVAAKYGFKGGLVPGVTVAGWMCNPALRHWGRAWLEAGTFEARFAAPFYDGDRATVDATESDGALVLEASSSQGLRATGHAALGPGPLVVPDERDFPVTPLPERPVAAEAGAIGALGVLGSLERPFGAAANDAYLGTIAEPLRLTRELGVAHPADLLRDANYILALNVDLPPWIHTSSVMSTFGVVPDGSVVSCRARVTDLFERKGHSFVRLDVAWFTGEGRPVQRADHTAIYRIAEKA